MQFLSKCFFSSQSQWHLGDPTHKPTIKVFANTLWPSSVPGQLHLVLQCLCLDGNHMPVLFPNATVFLSEKYSGRPWQGGSSTNSSHSLKPKIFMLRGSGKKCTLTFSRNVLCNLLGYEESLLQPPQEISVTRWTSMNAFADTVSRDLSLDSVSVYRIERNRLRLCSFGLEVPLCFSIGDCFLAWL